jgi:hypothetical protein
MKRSLSRVVALTLYHFDDGVRKDGPPPGVRGDLTDVVGDLTGVRGDLSGVWGDLTNVWGDLTGVVGNLTDVVGNLSGVWGDLTDVVGDLSDCGLTDNDRRRGVNVEDLISCPEDETPEAAQEAGEQEKP